MNTSRFPTQIIQQYRRSIGLAAIAALALHISTAPSLAASATWNGTTDSLWATADNWSASPVPGTGDTATFDNAGNANTTLDLGGGVSITRIIFDTGSAAAYTIGSGAVGSQTLTLDNAGAIALNSGVANNQLFNVNLTLPTIANGTTFFTNGSSSLLTIAGNISSVPAAGNSLLTVTNTGGVTITGAITETGAGSLALLKTGPGTLTLANGSAWSGNAAIGRIPVTSAGFPLVAREGTLLLSGGTHTVTGELVVGGVVADGGAGQNAKIIIDTGALNVSSWFSIGRGNGVGGVSSDVVLSNNATLSSPNLSMGFNGSGAANQPKNSLTLNGTSSYTVTGNDANFNVGESAGSYSTVTLNGSSTFTHNGGGSGSRFGLSGTGVMDIASASATANFRNLIIGPSASGVGAVYNKGTLLSINLDGLFLGDGATSASYFRNDNASAVVVNANAANIAAAIGSGANAVVDVVSGTLTGTRVGSGFFNNNANNGQFNVLGGLLGSGASSFLVADVTTRTGNKWCNVNVSGSGQFTNITVNLSNPNAAGNTGILSVNGGGTVVADTITATGTSPDIYVNFNNGTLRAAGATAVLVSANVDRMTVYSGGVSVDTAGFNKSIATVIAAPSGNGVTNISLSGTGTGYEGRPIIKITGGGGTGASAMADFDPTTGLVTGVTITSPGSGYTSAPTVTNLGGGGSALTATAAIGPVTGGGLTKTGSGTLTNTAANTFSGDVNVNAGILSANLGNNTLNPVSSALGNPQVARNINVNNGGTLQFLSGDSLGSAISAVVATLVVNQGGVVTNNNNNFNTLGAVQMNGGTLTGGGGAVAGYQMYTLRGNVTVGGTSMSTITGSGTFAGYHLAAPTVFNVADVTAGDDLTVSGILVDRNAGDGGSGSLTKTGAGTMVLSSVNTYNGNTTISNGVLKLSGSGLIANSPTITVASGATFDVSASGFTLGAGKTLQGSGTVAGSVTTAGASSTILPGSSAGTLTITNNLDMSAGAGTTFELSTSYNTGNDQIVVGGNLTLSSSDTISISALSGAAELDTNADYVLFQVGSTATMTTTPALQWVGTPPTNYLSYSIQKVGQNVVLRYTAATAPTLTATSTPASVTRNQAVTVTATITPGSGSVTNVQINASAIGGSATASLVLDTGNVYTNTFVVASSIAPGVKLMAVIATDTTPLSSPAYTVTNTVVATNEVWTGLGSDDNWSTSPNWNSVAPGFSGDSVTFAGSTQTSPDMDNIYSVTGVTFDTGASSFTIGSSTSSTLTLTGGVTNNSANSQTLNVPVTLSGAQTFDAAAGPLTFGQALANGGNTVTVTGPSNTVFSSAVSGGGGLTKTGNSQLTLAGNYTASGLFLVAGGTAVVSGTASPGTAEVRAGGGGVGAINVETGGTLTVSNWLVTGRDGGNGTINVNGGNLVRASGGNITMGSLGTTPSGTLNLNSGSISNLSGETYLGEGSSAINFGFYNQAGGTASLGNFYVGRGLSSGQGIGNASISGGVASVGNIEIGFGFNNTRIGTNVMTISSGATVNASGYVRLAYAGSSSLLGIITNNGGTLNVGATALYMGFWPDGCVARLTLDSGAINLQNNSSIIFGQNGTAGAGNTFVQNGGDVTFYSDAGVTVGGTGSLNLGNTGGGTHTYTLAGGTLTVPQVRKAGGTSTATFNFNGGTVKPTASSATFLQGLSAANVQSGGALINTDGKDITVGQALLAAGGGLTKSGAGTLTLSGASTYAGATVIQNGTLALSGSGSIALSSSITVSNGATFNVSAIGYTLASGQTLKGNGVVTGNVATASSSSSIQPGSSAGTLTFNNNLNLSAGSSATFELSTSASSGNDQVGVGGNLTLNNSSTIHISALSGAVNLDTTADYVLFSVAGTTTMASTPALVWDGTTPANYLNYNIVQVGNNVVLRYTSASTPTVTASASPATATRNQTTTITATVTPGSGNIASVTVDLSQIGGSSSAALVLSNNFVYTNTFSVSAGTSAGAKSLNVTVTDDTSPTPLTSSYVITPFTVTVGNPTWDGGGSDDNFTSNLNWVSDAAPGLVGDSLTFAGLTRLTPSMDTNYNVTSLTFDGTAGSFTIGTANSSTLTSGSGGIANNSSSAQTLNVPIVMSAAQMLNAAAGNLAFSANLNNGGFGITVAGVSNTAVGGVISGAGGLTKNDSGTVTLTGNNTFTGSVLGKAGTIVIDSGGGVNNGGSISSIGVDGTDNATLTLKGTGSFTNTADFNVGNVGSASGVLNLQDSAAISVSRLYIASANASGSTASGTVNQTGGIVVQTDGGIGTFAIGGRPDGSTNSVGVYDISGGTLTAVGGIRVGGSGTGSLNVSGTATVNANAGINIARLAGGRGTANLDGGTLNTFNIATSTGANATNNFNGATVKPTAANGTWISGLTRANVRNGGAIFDTAGFDVTIPQVLAHSDVSGDNATDGGLTKNGAGTLTLTGASTFNGAVTINAGTVYANPGNGANNRAFSYVTNITINSGGTLRSGPNGLFGWDGTQEKPITVNSGGTLTANGALTSDVGVGTVTLAGGTLATIATGATDYGSWRFDNSGDALVATDNSTASAENVKFQNGGAINVAAGKTLNFTGTIIDTGFGGISTVVKSGGSGTLVLVGNNTYTGGTTVEAGTLQVNGAIGSGAVTVKPGATLGGAGTVGGAVTVEAWATLSPGASVGTLTINNDLSLNGNLAVELNKSASPSNDLCVVAGTLTRTGGGFLVVANLGPALANGDSFTLFNQPLPNGGTFTITPAPGTSLAWSNRLAIDGSLLVVPAGSSNYTERLYAVVEGTPNKLISFQNDAPGTLLTSVDLGANIVGIDFVGETLYGVGSSSLYTIDRVTGATTLVGTFSPVLNGTGFGVEAEPSGVRVVSDLDQQLVLSYGNGAATVGTPLIGGGATTASGMAYHPGTGVRYVVDTGNDTLGTLDPVTGLVTTIGSTGNDFSKRNGFDISGKAAYAGYVVSAAGSSGPSANLYTINLGTGESQLQGLIGDGDPEFLIRGIAVGPEFSTSAAVNSTPTNITSLVIGSTNLVLSWPSSHLGWTLQMQTNSRAIGLNTNWVDVVGSESITATNFPIDKADPTLFYRLRLLVP